MFDNCNSYMPVSYTHLDVYKRQLLLRVIGDKSGSQIAVESLSVGRLRVVGGSGKMPDAVPETHVSELPRDELRAIV